MSAHYDTEPPPTASATLHTTVGPITISLFARQTPLACKNFLQHCLDSYYTNTTFHRIVPNFILQAGDPTGTGSGGSSIYEHPDFEFDSRDGEKVVFGDEIHSRLRFNRRGLVGMAKSEDGSYGSQFFITLGNVEREMSGSCTMFGRVEGEGIYNVVKIAEGEVVAGTERPVYAVRVTGCEVGELGPFEGVLRRRERVDAVAEKGKGGEASKAKKGKEKKKKKGAKALLSFGVDEEDGEEDSISIAKATKPKFNPKLVRDDGPKSAEDKPEPKAIPSKEAPSPSSPPPPPKRPSIPDPHTQLPLPDEEQPSRSPSHSSPSRSPSPAPKSSLSRTNAEIAALKASMKRDTATTPAEPPRKKTALESLIPETSIRGRKRRAQGNGGGGDADTFTSSDKDALKMFNAFKARLESAEETPRKKTRRDGDDAAAAVKTGQDEKRDQEGEGEGEEEQLCDLHFIVNCQSCRAWDVAAHNDAESGDNPQSTSKSQTNNDEDDEKDWMTHTLQFGRDMLGKDLSWKRNNQDADDLVVIDPRQKEKEVIGGRKRERERRRKMEGVREWDQRGK